MISYQQGKPHLYPLSQETSVVRSALRSCNVENYAFSSDWLQVQRQLSLLPYVIDLQSQINALREKLDALERQRDELLAARGAENDAFTLRLDVEYIRPARIIGEVESPFYFFGEDAEE